MAIVRPEISLCGVSLAEQPLHILNKIPITVPGSLKPSVAYSLLKLAELKKTDIFLDPMAGSGIIAIKAAPFVAKTIAGDIDRNRIEIAKKNSQNIIKFHVWDARDTKLPDSSVDKIVCNLPFDKQVKLNTEEFFSSFIEEMHRISKKDARFVFLTRHGSMLSEIMLKKGMLIKDRIKIISSGLDSEIIVALKIK
jgi:tRNA G10  N-methylase Trm11